MVNVQRFRGQWFKTLPPEQYNFLEAGFTEQNLIRFTGGGTKGSRGGLTVRLRRHVWRAEAVSIFRREKMKTMLDVAVVT